MTLHLNFESATFHTESIIFATISKICSHLGYNRLKFKLNKLNKRRKNNTCILASTTKQLTDHILNRCFLPSSGMLYHFHAEAPDNFFFFSRSNECSSSINIFY